MNPVDEEQAVQVIREEVTRQLNVPFDELQDNQFLIDTVLENFKVINWDAIANGMNVTKRRAKRWFTETFQRHNIVKVTKEDIHFMKDRMLQMLEDNIDLNSMYANRTI